MKRVLSLVLALSLVLGSIPAGFAATAGETLKGYGLLSGDASGNLQESKNITRGEMMVVYAQLLGKFAEAKAYSIPSTSKDVAGHWAANYISFAEKESWTAGMGNGMFAPDQQVTLQQLAAFMLKALGYTVTDYAKVVEQAKTVGLLKDVVATDATAKVLRSDVFTSALNTINTPSKDSTVKLGEKLGVLKPEVAASVKFTAASAVAHNVIAVTMETAPTAVDAKVFAVTDKDGKAIEVKGATIISGKTVWLDTADLTAGAVYTVKSGDVSLKVTAVQKDASLPELDKANSAVMDNVTVKLTFLKNMDPRKALVAANYSIDNKLEVKSAAFDKNTDGTDNRKVVLLTTSAQTANQIYKLTIGANVTDYFGNKVKSDSEGNILTFGGIKADTTAPKLATATAINAVKVVLNFTEDSDLNKEIATNVANYTIANLTAADKKVTVSAAKLVKDAAGKYTQVELTTTTQVTSNKYEITVANIADKFGNVVASTSTKATFYGQAPDTTAPTVKVATAISNTLVKVVFSETVDATTAETAANYVFNKSLTTVKAVVDADDDTIVWVTTSAQKGAEVYEMTVSNVKDEYNNAITSTKTSFAGIALNETAPTVKSAYAKVESGSTYVYVSFDMNMNATTTKVASNYYFGDVIGYGISATKVSDTEYKIKVNALTDGKLYTVKVTGATSIDDILIKDTSNTAQFVGVTTADTEKPAVSTAVALDARTMKIAFSKAMVNGTAANNTNIDYLVANVANYTIKDITTVSAANATNMTLPNVVSIIVGDDENEVTIRYATDVFASGKLYEVTAAATLAAKNNVALAMDTDKDTATFGGTSSAVTVPKIVGVYSINKSTVDIKFNVPVQKIGALTLTFTPDVNTNVLTTADTTNSTVLSNDKYTLRVATVAELTGGAKYSVDAASLNGTIKDLHADQTVSSTTAKTEFYANSATNTKPSISSVTNYNASALLVTMSEDVQAFNGTTFDLTKFTVNGNAAKYVQYKDSTVNKTDLIVFFDNSVAQVGAVGSVKEFKVLANGVKDLVGAANEETKANFVVSSNDRTAPKISDIAAIKVGANYTKVRVIFNTAVTGLEASDFTVTSGGVSVAVTGLEDADGVAIVNNKYFTTVDITFAANLTAKSAVVVAFDGDNTTLSTGKDGKAAELTSTDSLVVPE